MICCSSQNKPAHALLMLLQTCKYYVKAQTEVLTPDKQPLLSALYLPPPLPPPLPAVALTPLHDSLLVGKVFHFCKLLLNITAWRLATLPKHVWLKTSRECQNGARIFVRWWTYRHQIDFRLYFQNKSLASKEHFNSNYCPLSLQNLPLKPARLCF